MSAEVWTVYELHAQADGTITGRASTNDDEDRGYPTEFAEWPVRYADRAAMLERTGGTHYGFAGHRVTVRLDGREVPAPEVRA